MTKANDQLNFEKPLTTVDVAVFSLQNNQLCVLLVKRPNQVAKPDYEPFPGQWALVGGFVDLLQDSDLEATAKRKLLEKTGVKTAYLEQLGSWGSANRDPRGWSATHVYFSILAIDDTHIKAINTAALPISLARLASSWRSIDTRSTTASTAEFNSSTINTSNTLAIINAISIAFLPK